MMTVKERLDEVRRRIEKAAQRAGRDPASVRLVAVTKGVEPGRIREAIEAGADILGENRVQEATAKMTELGRISGISWHLIGTLQRNKARAAVERFDLIHSVDGLPLAQDLNRHAADRKKRQPVLVQVNVSGEAAKHGVSPDRAADLAGWAGAAPGLRLLGLMTIPPLPRSPEDSRPYYRALFDLARNIERRTGLALPELSMGMSGDYEVAVEEGATLVRVGTAIFGERS
jgi:pyridoxal phosphate enzyme (YggS family)